MNKTELLNKLARDNGERLLLARALDKLELARQRNIPACTGFLSPQERASVENLLNTCGHPRHLFFGGYEGAERTVCAFLPDWQEGAHGALRSLVPAEEEVAGMAAGVEQVFHTHPLLWG